MAVGICTCHQGRTGDACKHQQAIVFHYKVTSCNYLPASASERNVLLEIATGSKLKLIKYVFVVFSESIMVGVKSSYMV